MQPSLLSHPVVTIVPPPLEQGWVAPADLLAFELLHQRLAVLVVAIQGKRVTGGRKRSSVIAEMLVDEGQVAVHLGAVTAQPRRCLVRLAGPGPIGIGGRIAAGVLVERVIPSLDCVGGFIRNVGAGLSDGRPRLRYGLSLRRVVVGI